MSNVINLFELVAVPMSCVITDTEGLYLMMHDAEVFVANAEIISAKNCGRWLRAVITRRAYHRVMSKTKYDLTRNL